MCLLSRISLAFLILLAFASSAVAGSISLMWDASPNGDAAGYFVFYGPAPGFYTGAVDAGNHTSATIRGLAGGVTYYFVVQAYTSTGGVSTPSNEVPASTTNSPPQVVNPGSRTIAAGASVTLPVSAVDADADPLTYYATGLPAGLTIDPATGVISGTIAPTENGAHAVTIIVTDGPTATTVAFNWNVHLTDQAPVVPGLPSQSSPVGAVVSAQVVASDSDGDVLAYGATGLPPGVTINPASGLITGTLTSTGLFSVTVSASDGLLTNTESFSWTILATNAPPTLVPPGDRSTSIVNTVSVQLLASDPDGNTLTFTSSGLPPGLTLDRVSGLITGRPLAPGVSSVTVFVSDGLATVNQTFSWTVSPDNPPVVTNPGAQIAVEGQFVALQINAYDPDGLQLSYIPTLPPGLSISSQGVISGVLTYGTSGTFSVSVTASDGEQQTSVTFPWTILAAPKGPSFVQQRYAVPQTPQSAVSLPYGAAQTAGNLNVVIVGWRDSTQHVQSVTDVKGNAYVLAVGPTVLAGFGSQSIYYAQNISAANAAENVVTVTFDGPAAFPDIRIAEYSGIDPVYAIDVATTAQGSSAMGDTGTLTTGTAQDLLVAGGVVEMKATGVGSGNTPRLITTPDGDVTMDRLTSAAGGYNATASLASSGRWIMQVVAFRLAGQNPTITSATPTSAPVGGAVTITGTHFGPTQGTSTLAVNGIGAAAAAWSDSSITVIVPVGVAVGSASVVVTVGGVSTNAVSFTLLPTPTLTSRSPGSGVPGAPITLTGTNFGPTQESSIVMMNGAVAGTISWSATAIVVPVPLAGTASGNIVVTVNGVASNSLPFVVQMPPTLPSIPNQSNFKGDVVNLATNGSDPDGDTLTYSASGLPPALTINPATGVITGTLTLGSAGTYNPTVSVNDGTFSSVSQSFTWTVANRPPVITPVGTMATLTGAPVSLQVSGSDPDGDPVTYSATGLPSGASIDANSGLISGTPTVAGVYTVTITASDGAAQSNRSFTWTITAPGSGRVTFMQARSSTVFSNTAAVPVSYPASQTAGSLDVVVVNWSDSAVPISSVTGTGGMVYQLAVGPATSPQIGSQSIYYLPNVPAANAGTNVVTVAFGSAVAKAEVRLAEYQGIEPANVLDVTSGAQGDGAEANSGTVTTTFRNDLLFGAVWSSWATATSPEGGLTARLTTPSGTLLEDTTLSAVGPYDVRASIDPPNPWIIQLVAFRDVNHAPVLSNPGNQLSAANTTVSLPLAATDSDGDTLTFSATGLPPGLNVNAASGVISGTLPWPSAGVYNVTATVSDGRLSNSQLFAWTVNGPTVSASVTSFNPGTPVTVSWNAIPTPTPTDWIGLFAPGSSDTTPVTYSFTTGAASGSSVVTFPTTLPFGTYELRLFSQNSYQKLAVSGPLTVAGTTVTAGPTTVGPGATVTATWSGVGSPTSTDWVVLVNTTAPDTSYIAWTYTNGQSAGQVGLVVPMSVVAGTYEVRLFSNNSFRRIGVSGQITIQTTSLTASPTNVGPGSNVTATWSSIGTQTPNDWVVLVKTGSPDSAYLAWGYTDGSSNGSRDLTIPKTAAAGTYELRLFANGSTKRLAVSNQITVPGVALTASPSTLAAGGTLTVAWQYLGVPTSTDWLALVPTGAADVNWVAWIYSTGRGADSTLFNIPATLPAGNYEVRMFANNTFKSLAVSNTLTVAASGPTLATSPVSTVAGGTLTVAWRNIAAPTQKDWVGLYTVGSTDASFITKTYTNGRATDQMLMTLPGNVSTGSYELRLFSNDSLTLLATSNGFSVVTGALVSASPSMVNAGGTLNVSWAGIAAPTASDWLGLVPLNGADSAYLAWHFTNGAASGAVNLSIPSTVPTGTYEIRLFAQNSFQRLAVANLINVGPTLSANPTPAAPGGTLTVTWAGIVGPTARDWLALVPLNAANSQWIAWQYTDATATGSKTFNIPANAPAGSYDVRLFTNDTMTRIASSDKVISIAAGPSLSVRNAGLTATYHAGDTIQTLWSGIAAPSPSDWIGVYAAGAADGAYVYQTTTSGQATGSKSIVLPSGLTSGQYELRLFSNGTVTRLAVSNSFKIQ